MPIGRVTAFKSRGLLSFAIGDWVLNLDADESVDAQLQASIKVAIASSKADAYRIPIAMHFYGCPLRFSSSPKRHVRLFKRQGACYSQDIVHEKIVLPAGARIRKIKQSLNHYSFRDLSHALYKINRYSSYSAKIKIEKNQVPSFAKTLLATGWMFFRCYFLQRGFLDGKPGFILAALNAQGTFYRGIKQLYRDSQLDKLPNSMKRD